MDTWTVDINKIGELLLYKAQEPLLFNSGLFLFIFTIFLFIYRGLRYNESARIVYVILFSLYFYYKSSGLCVFILVFLALFDYFMGLKIGNASNKTWRKVWMIFNLSVDLGILCYFKYTNFLLGSLSALFHQPFDPFNIVLPAGISFFIFQSLSYIIDVYREEIEPLKRFTDYAFYATFFPPLIAGPIVRARDFIPQIHRPLFVSPEMMNRGVFLIMSGLFKKVVISDYISVNFVDRIFDNPQLYSGFENLMAVYGYALQIYCDFSGYSDMAIGIALLLGFRFNQNFDSPYQSASITEFWRRWHISLSSWLKDYLYISLGGNRKGKIRTYANLLITMLLGGLWHGASVLFIIWGAWHGVLLAMHKWLMSCFPGLKKIPTSGWHLSRVLGILITFNLVCIGWVFFRARSFETVQQIFTQIFTHFHSEVAMQFLTGYPIVVGLMVLGYFLHFLPSKCETVVWQRMVTIPVPIKALFLALLIFLVVQVKSSDLLPFIYFQF